MARKIITALLVAMGLAGATACGVHGHVGSAHAGASVH